MCELVDFDINSIVKAICEKEGIQNFHFELVGTNKKGEGYLGDIQFVTITDTETKRKIPIVVKRAFEAQDVRQRIPVKESYQNEIRMYSKVLPKFMELQKQVGVKDRFSQTAHCYAFSIKGPHEFIVLENVKEKGFTLVDKTKLLSSDYVELIFEKYGKFHGLSYVYKEKYPEEFRSLHSNLIDILDKFMKTPFFVDLIKLGGTLGSQSLIPGVDDKVIAQFDEYKNNAVDIFNNIIQYKGKWGVITHGDCWSNNMMFKHDKNGKPIDLILLDLQISKLGSPVYDLSYCLYSGAGKSTFDNLDKYLKIYYKSLTDFLKESQFNSKIFTFEEFKEEWRQYAKFGLTMGLMLIRGKLQNEEDIKDLTEELDFADHFANTKYDVETAKKRMRDLILHVYEIDAL